MDLENYHTHKIGLGESMEDKGGKENKKWIESIKFPRI